MKLKYLFIMDIRDWSSNEHTLHWL